MPGAIKVSSLSTSTRSASARDAGSLSGPQDGCVLLVVCLVVLTVVQVRLDGGDDLVVGQDFLRVGQGLDGFDVDRHSRFLCP